MTNRWAEVFTYGMLAGAATFSGMYLVLMRAAWSRRHSASLVSYAAGVLLGVGILHLLPETMELAATSAPAWILVSFVLFYFLEHHFLVHAGHEQLHHSHLDIAAGHGDGCQHPHPLGMVAFVGLGLHSLIDGLIIGTGFEAGEGLGLVAALGVIAHEVPEGIAMLAILLHYGYQRRSAILLTALVAIATPFGAIITYALIRGVTPSALGALMAFAAGSFIYIAASDLIPESHRARGWQGSLALSLGIATAILAGFVAH